MIAAKRPLLGRRSITGLDRERAGPRAILSALAGSWAQGVACLRMIASSSANWDQDLGVGEGPSRLRQDKANRISHSDRLDAEMSRGEGDLDEFGEEVLMLC